jgi:hypothetical protein
MGRGGPDPARPPRARLPAGGRRVGHPTSRRPAPFRKSGRRSDWRPGPDLGRGPLPGSGRHRADASRPVPARPAPPRRHTARPARAAAPGWSRR